MGTGYEEGCVVTRACFCGSELMGDTFLANGDRFHISFLRFFRLYCTVFLNSFGIQGYVSNVSVDGEPCARDVED